MSSGQTNARSSGGGGTEAELVNITTEIVYDPLGDPTLYIVWSDGEPHAEYFIGSNDEPNPVSHFQALKNSVVLVCALREYNSSRPAIITGAAEEISNIGRDLGDYRAYFVSGNCTFKCS